MSALEEWRRDRLEEQKEERETGPGIKARTSKSARASETKLFKTWMATKRRELRNARRVSVKKDLFKGSDAEGAHRKVRDIAKTLLREYEMSADVNQSELVQRLHDADALSWDDTLESLDQLVLFVKNFTSRSLITWASQLREMFEKITIQKTRERVAAIFRNAELKGGTKTAASINPKVYENTYTMVMQPLLDMREELNIKPMYSSIRKACFVLFLFFDRNITTRKNVILDRVESMEAQLAGAATSASVLDIIVASYSALLARYNAGRVPDVKQKAFRELAELLIKNFIQEPDKVKTWNARYANVTADPLQATYQLILLVSGLLDEIIEQEKPIAASSVSEVVNDLLAQDVPPEVREVLQPEVLTAAATQAASSERVRDYAEEQLARAYAEASTLREEVDRLSEALEKAESEKNGALATAARFQAIGPALTRSFLLADTKNDEVEFVRAWTLLASARPKDIVGLLCISLLMLRAKYLTAIGGPLANKIAEVRRATNSITEASIREFVLTHLANVAAIARDSISAQDWSTLEQTWRAAADASSEDVGGILADMLKRYLGVDKNDLNELRNIASNYVTTQPLDDFTNQWNAAFAADGMDAAEVSRLVRALIDSVLLKNTELATARQEYEQAGARLSELNIEVERTASLIQTLEQNRADANRAQKVQDDEDAAAARQAQELSARRQRFNEAFATAVRAGDDMTELREEGERIRRAESAHAQRAAAATAKLTELNGRLAIAAADLAAANEHMMSLIAQRDAESRAQQSRASQINQYLSNFSVADVSNVKNAIPASMEWFDALQQTLRGVHAKLTAAANLEADLRARETTASSNLADAKTTIRDLRAKEEKYIAEARRLQTNLNAAVTSIKGLHSTYVGQKQEPFDLKKIVAALDNKLKDSAKLAAVRGELVDKERAIETLERSERQLNANMAQLTEQLREIRTDASKADDQRDEAKEAERQLREDVQGLNAQLAELQQKLNSTQDELVKAREAHAGARETLESLRKEKDDAGTALAIMRADIERLEDTIKKNNTASDQQRSTLLAIQAEKDELERKLILLQQAKVEPALRNAKLQEQLDAVQQQLDRLQKSYQELQEIQAPLEQTNAELRRQQSELERSLEEKNAQVAEIKQRFREAEAKAANLKELTKAKRNAAEKVLKDHEATNARVSTMERQLRSAREASAGAEKRLEAAQHTIQLLERALKEAESAREELAARANTTPADMSVFLARLKNPAAVQTADDIVAVAEKLPSDLNANAPVERSTQAARSVLQEILVQAASSLKVDSEALAQAAVQLNRGKKRSRLMEKAQSEVAQMSAEEAPTFTRLVAPRVEIDNTFSATTNADVAALIEIDDAHEYFESIMKSASEDTGVPAHVLDQFYVFTTMVEGMVAAPHSFWQSKHNGMRALVSHAIEASTKTTQNVFPVRSTKQSGAIRERVLNTYRKIFDAHTPQPNTIHAPGVYILRITRDLNLQWPSAIFSAESVSNAASVRYNGNIGDFLEQMTEVTVDVLTVQHPGTSVSRASHLSVIKYIKDLFKTSEERTIATRSEVLDYAGVPGGSRLFSVLVSIVDKVFYASLQRALQAAQIPLDFNDPDFVNALYDTRMAEYVATLYTQAFTRSRYTISTLRANTTDIQVSTVLQLLAKYKENAPKPAFYPAKRQLRLEAPVRIKREREAEEEEPAVRRARVTRFASGGSSSRVAISSNDMLSNEWPSD